MGCTLRKTFTACSSISSSVAGAFIEREAAERTSSSTSSMSARPTISLTVRKPMAAGGRGVKGRGHHVSKFMQLAIEWALAAAWAALRLLVNSSLSPIAPTRSAHPPCTCAAPRPP